MPCARRRTNTAISPAAQAASRRRCIGVVPAWAARPVIAASVHDSPVMPSTAPMTTPSLSRTGPCSMCSSRYPCGGGKPGRAGPGGADIAEARQSLADGCAVEAADRVGILERKAADIDQAPHRIGWKARALLIGEGDERQRPARGAACVVDRLARFEARQHAVETVVAAAGPDRVDVGAEHDGRQVLAAATHADDV